jgi:tetratricopeptide (TPR) repeat protein
MVGVRCVHSISMSHVHNRIANRLATRLLIFSIYCLQVDMVAQLGRNHPSTNSEQPAYELPFGRDRFLPSQAELQLKRFLDPKEIPRASYCGTCHQEAHRQWRESAHSNSFREPFYMRNVNILVEEKGLPHTRHCEGCHNPIALFSGSLTPNSKIDRSFDNDGVTCMVCHSIAKIKNNSGTGSYEFAVPAVMVRDDGSAVTGEVNFDDILAHPEQHKRAVMKDFLHTSEFCSVCHKASIPKTLNGYKWQRAFSVYDEWQQSSWSRETVLPFYKKETVSTCQTCHMQRAKIEAGDYGGADGSLSSHRWLGANTAIPTFYHFDEQLRQTEAFLKNDLLKVDIFALRELGSTQAGAIAPLDKTTFTLLRGETVIVDVVIQNKGIGHGLVPEQRDFYECWVEFRAVDAAGRELLSSGFLNPDGSLDEAAHSYTNRLISNAGRLLDHHEVWKTRVKAYDRTLLPGRSEAVHYKFRIPQEAKGSITLTAKVRYRRFRKQYTDWVLNEDSRYPIVDMASKSLRLNLGLNTQAEPPSKEKDLLRWNNYGVALIDQQEFNAAIAVFKEALRLDPDYVDAYTNMAVAELSQNNYASAQKFLSETLKHSPGNPRALAYRGIVYRLQYKLDQAIAVLSPLVPVYPKLRQARQELGYAYFLQKKYALAREQYEALQRIDPDDIQAHRWLAPVYLALGLKEKAAQEAAAYSDQVEEPGYSYVMQNYWRTHPLVAYEVLPHHVHGETAKERQAAIEQLLKPSAVWPDKGSSR